MTCLSVFDHFVGLALKGLILEAKFGEDPENIFADYMIVQNVQIEVVIMPCLENHVQCWCAYIWNLFAVEALFYVLVCL